MNRTLEQTQEALEKMRQDGVPDEDLQTDDILIENGDGIILVRKSTFTYVAGDYYFGVNYEMWLNREMYGQGIYGEFLEDGEEAAYCIPLAAAEDREAMDQYNKVLEEIAE